MFACSASHLGTKYRRDALDFSFPSELLQRKKLISCGNRRLVGSAVRWSPPLPFTLPYPTPGPPSLTSQTLPSSLAQLKKNLSKSTFSNSLLHKCNQSVDRPCVSAFLFMFAAAIGWIPFVFRSSAEIRSINSPTESTLVWKERAAVMMSSSSCSLLAACALMKMKGCS
ncbi:hypothetical protein T02_5350 [Trichinella nativa]|uniref:Uncharacterized protein n=1 Tax=Trichinella nativa TaxID=6335 RepID=A0A0V1LHU2_9BILA|nr:hypothetical protein T02_5350 [Trichinella nativa]